MEMMLPAVAAPQTGGAPIRSKLFVQWQPHGGGLGAQVPVEDLVWSWVHLILALNTRLLSASYNFIARDHKNLAKKVAHARFLVYLVWCCGLTGKLVHTQPRCTCSNENSLAGPKPLKGAHLSSRIVWIARQPGCDLCEVVVAHLLSQAPAHKGDDCVILFGLAGATGLAIVRQKRLNAIQMPVIGRGCLAKLPTGPGDFLHQEIGMQIIPVQHGHNLLSSREQVVSIVVPVNEANGERIWVLWQRAVPAIQVRIMQARRIRCG